MHPPRRRPRPGLLALAACGSGSGGHAPSAFACHAGAWRDADGGLFVLTAANDSVRYRLPDGRTGLFRAVQPGREAMATEGWRDDGPAVARAVSGECDGGVAFAPGDATPAAATRIPLVVEETRFGNDGLSLRGRLVLPADATTAPPLAVLVHGSERSSAVDGDAMQYLLPAQGVAVFVYDKRGTGGSSGEYTQDFHALAGDAVAALQTARRMRPGGFPRAGYVGASQGGWGSRRWPRRARMRTTSWRCTGLPKDRWPRTASRLRTTSAPGDMTKPFWRRHGKSPMPPRC